LDVPLPYKEEGKGWGDEGNFPGWNGMKRMDGCGDYLFTTYYVYISFIFFLWGVDETRGGFS